MSISNVLIGQKYFISVFPKNIAWAKKIAHFFVLNWFLWWRTSFELEVIRLKMFQRWFEAVLSFRIHSFKTDQGFKKIFQNDHWKIYHAYRGATLECDTLPRKTVLVLEFTWPSVALWHVTPYIAIEIVFKCTILNPNWICTIVIFRTQRNCQNSCLHLFAIF